MLALVNQRPQLLNIYQDSGNYTMFAIVVRLKLKLLNIYQDSGTYSVVTSQRGDKSGFRGCVWADISEPSGELRI